MGRAADLHGVAGLRTLLNGTPAAERDRLLRLEPVGVRCGAGLDRVLSRNGELSMLGQHLQRRTGKPDPTHVTPQCAIEVDCGSATRIRSTPLKSGISAEGVAKRAESPKVQPTGQRLGRVAVESLQLIGD